MPRPFKLWLVPWTAFLDDSAFQRAFYHVAPLELSSVEGELEKVQGHDLCSATICTPGCHAFLTSLKDALGCCWAELLAVSAKVMGPDTLEKAGVVRFAKREESDW